MWRALADLLFPRACAGCGAMRPEGLFCARCRDEVEILPSWRCRLCSGTLPPPLRRGEKTPGLCTPCTEQRPAFDGVWAPFVYGGPVARAVHRLKYHGERGLAARLAAPMREAGKEALAVVDALAHLPVHPSRLRERGYDQASLLAAALAGAGAGSHARSALWRLRAAGPQVGRGREDRSAAMVGAFRAKIEGLGRSFVLVDDVVTTGATANAAARALKEAGAGQVFVLAFARAL